ncbi:MAG TPA: beta-propeller domain-containing protein [Acidimicrobiales bacterium]|nr:beta-propeller domain-containing protein [Acidimicrobiales bacterium]
MRVHLRIATVAALTLGVGLGACTTDDDGAGPLGGIGSLQFAARLKPAGNCDSLLDHLRDEAEARVGPYGLSGGPVLAFDAMGPAGGRTAAAPQAQEAKGTGGGVSDQSFSTTNVQEVGIDEPDLVKTDGSRILVIANGAFHVVDLTGAAPALVGTIDLGDENFRPSEILVSGSRVLVFGTAGGFRRGVVMPNARVGGIAAEDFAPDLIARSQASITELDLSVQSAPRVVKRLEVEGDYVTARQIGAVARVVVRSYPQELPFVYPQNESGEARAKELNQQTVRESKLEDWMPLYRLVDANGEPLQQGQLTQCTNVDLPTEFAGFGSLSVLTFDLTKPIGNGDAVSILSSADTVYASDKNLYVATTSYITPEAQQIRDFSAEFSTSIHSFDIDGNKPASYTASGSVPGHLLNQFSMSEHDGHLRAATTNGAPWSSGTDSSITVLRRDGDRLDRVGQVSGMGKGERIYSVRYVGPTAYVVTFRQTDPFYTVDLSNPAAPRVVGELKIPGYSGYLHQIGASHVLGIGQDANDQGRVLGTKVSLFDVSDLANPTEMATWKQANSNTQAEYDHHAFLYWDERKIAVLPVFGNNGSNSAVILSIDPQTGINEAGRISHSQSSPIVRSLVAADQLWTVSNDRLQANSFTDLAVTSRIDL